MTEVAIRAIPTRRDESPARRRIGSRTAAYLRLLRRRAVLRQAYSEPLDARLLADIGLDMPHRHRDRWIEAFIRRW